MNNIESNNHLSGVKCHVTNCKYHDTNNCCTAPEIQINTCCNSCHNSCETDCDTFTPIK